MESVIISRRTLPETIFSYIHSEQIKLVEENGTVTLSPVVEKHAILEKALGMFPKLSSERFMKEKALEKELEK